ncbi:collagen alpha-1(XII) chain-like, partial [Plectropomus leopardus]|uniref:collagen alpha-1(XII) chain-like n=1 Tax=Plectropomus leopardus TaxID=160734 RepID=UPI001C4C3CD7
AQCEITAKADIMLLLDGSWSIGRVNFRHIRSFIAKVVNVFNIGPDRVQIGLTQYSGDPKTEWHLETHQTKHSLMHAIANLPYKGGNTMTGRALNHILDRNFKPNVGIRENSKRIVILITDGKSQDDIEDPSQKMKNTGIEIYAIGVKNADKDQLMSIASDPIESHLFIVDDFWQLLDFVDDLTIKICESVNDL